MKTLLKYVLVFGLTASCSAIAPEGQQDAHNNDQTASALLEIKELIKNQQKGSATSKALKGLAALLAASGTVAGVGYLAMQNNQLHAQNNALQRDLDYVTYQADASAESRTAVWGLKALFIAGTWWTGGLWNPAITSVMPLIALLT